MGPGNIIGWNHLGGHQSGSDLWEEQIWADGFLKVTTDPSWRTICSNHTSGTYAYCSTSFFHLLPRTINAKTNHFFHKSGYYDHFFQQVMEHNF